MYIKINNGTPESYSINQLRNDNPQTSFPADPSEALLAEYGVYPVIPTDLPTAAETEVVEDAGYLQLADGTWKKAWRVRPMTEEELVALDYQKDEQRRVAYQNEADPLFFKWQRGEGSQDAWLAKIAEIKARYSKRGFQ